MRDATYDLDVFDNGATRIEAVPYRNALNEVSRQEYLLDCEKGLGRWNKWIERAGHAFRLSLPSARFNRAIGSWSGVPTTPRGEPIDAAQFEANRDAWLPSQSDREYVRSLMQPVFEVGKMAAWIAPPDKGIKDKPVDYEYVRFA
jgi:benzoyl-CoA 2,3-dioxygenase component B